MDNCHLQWQPPYRLAQTPSLGALQTQLRVRVSCRAGADATPRRPCGAHLLAPASGGLCWHSGQSVLAVAYPGGLKVCSLNRNKISIGHFTGKTFTSALQHSCKGSREIILLMTLSASPQKPSSVGSKYRGLTTQEPDSLGCGPGLLGRGTFCPALRCQWECVEWWQAGGLSIPRPPKVPPCIYSPHLLGSQETLHFSGHVFSRVCEAPGEAECQMLATCLSSDEAGRGERSASEPSGRGCLTVCPPGCPLSCCCLF